jgi:hypothetical protein
VAGVVRESVGVRVGGAALFVYKISMADAKRGRSAYLVRGGSRCGSDERLECVSQALNDARHGMLARRGAFTLGFPKTTRER